jgi:hypothetical protein
MKTKIKNLTKYKNKGVAEYVLFIVEIKIATAQFYQLF